MVVVVKEMMSKGSDSDNVSDIVLVIKLGKEYVEMLSGKFFIEKILFFCEKLDKGLNGEKFF